MIQSHDFFVNFGADFKTMHKLYFILLVIISLAISASAQDVNQQEEESNLYQQLFRQDGAGGNVRILQEKKLDEILLQFMEQGRKLGGIPCYWIRIYSGSSHSARDEAYETKARFLQKYEGIRNDVIYDDPNFKVYIGGYRSKSETLKLLNKIKRDFPTAFIVYDIIDFPVE
ncbi:MAG: hypothetical protein AMS23_08120 [Bacteroides sp. SM1_62]|nr:MAG: hypothetical protein AMS26_15570 [Bacteroides sp. SM23_62]KPL22291.1 MAG: hypothetical protein AMS23_08120 [Bacteroides sp. SM1_62]